MKYRIGDVARLIGTSKEAIRYFEREGCIAPAEKTDSGYRQYDMYEVGVLRWLKLYRSYGFSLEEASTLIYASEGENGRPIMERGIERLEAEILWKQKLLQDLKELSREAAQAPKLHQQIRILDSPAYYRISLEYQGKFLFRQYEKDALEQWYAHMPLVRSIPLIYRSDLDKGIWRQDTGLGIREEDLFDEWDPAGWPHVRYFPSRPCIAVVLSSLNDISVLEPVFTFMDRNALMLDGDIFTCPLSIFEKDGHPAYYHCFWIPFRQT